MSKSHFYYCDACGEKTDVVDVLGRCTLCGRVVCWKCGYVIYDKVYCRSHANEDRRNQQRQSEQLIDKIARWLSVRRE